jgi:tRNA(Ile)-lysidine synthetase-like protein
MKRYDDISRIFYSELSIVNDNRLIIASVSGGVDSFVALHLLKNFYYSHKIVAVHINYNNRKECSLELDFVKQYCQLLEVQLFHRKIFEIKRDECRNHGLRDLYEDCTKQIRFDMYKQVAKTIGYDDYIVMLGHNKDDCFENIITNINQKTNYNNLSGMNIMTVIDDIAFWRPLLNIRKNEIVKYAIDMKIPYLHDSTPKWSMRGQIRDNVLPSLEKINPDVMNSFFELKDRMRDCEKLIQQYVIPNVVNKFTRHDNEITGDFSVDELIYDTNVWYQVISSPCFHGVSFTSKCMKEYIKFLQRFVENMKYSKNSSVKFIIRNTTHVSICETSEKKIKLSFKMA